MNMELAHPSSVCSVAPEELHVDEITPVSILLTWYPSSSNVEHAILLNGLKIGMCPPGIFRVSVKGLQPSTLYRSAVRAKDPKAVLEERPVERCIDFKTLSKIGLPEPPGLVQLDAGPQDGTVLLSWRPVDSQPRPPSRAAVQSYLIYADGKRIMEITSPSADHILLRLADLADDHPLFLTIRTKTREGSISADSNVVRVPRHDQPLGPSALNIPSASNGGLLMVRSTPIATIEQQPQTSLINGQLRQTTSDLNLQPTRTPTTYPTMAAQKNPAGQYYVFHPKLTRVHADTVEKPSLLEMENSYLLKHGNIPPTFIASLSTNDASVRSLPLIDPTTSRPFRTEQYSNAWQTLSPATRRRLERYVHEHRRHVVPSESRLLREARDSWKKHRSYSADEQVDDLVYGDLRPTLPHIQLASTNGSDPRKVFLDVSEDDWMQTLGLVQSSKAAGRQRPRYYQDTADSRTQSEPDLRIDDRLAQMALDPRRRCRLFVALFDYNHLMSPNINAVHEELSFRKGQIIKVHGGKDTDGFYYGELDRRFGLVPSNMVHEIDKDEAYRSTTNQFRSGPYRMDSRHPSNYYSRGSPVGERRKKSDAGQWINYSDPTLSRVRVNPAGYSDYDFNSFDEPLQDPRIRRMRWGSIKSRSYEHSDGRRRRTQYDPVQTVRQSYTVRPQDEYLDQALDYDRPVERRRSDVQFLPPEDFGRIRDHSLPSRPVDQNYLSDRVRRLYDPRFEHEDPRKFRDQRMHQDKRYMARDGRCDRQAQQQQQQQQQQQRDAYQSNEDRVVRRTVRDRDVYNNGTAQSSDSYGRSEMANYPGTSSHSDLPPRKSVHNDVEASTRVMASNSTRQMIAKFDYDSRELSPNVDADQMELSFQQGDLIVIHGEMDEDGFFIGELNGQRGLVPSNFLESLPQQPSTMLGSDPYQQGGYMPQQPQPQPPQQQQQQQQQRPKGVVFTDTGSTSSAPKTKSTPPRQNSQTSMGGTKSGKTGVQKQTKTLAKKTNDVGAKSGSTVRKTSQQTGKTTGKTGTEGGLAKVLRKIVE